MIINYMPRFFNDDAAKGRFVVASRSEFSTFCYLFNCITYESSHTNMLLPAFLPECKVQYQHVCTCLPLILYFKSSITSFLNIKFLNIETEQVVYNVSHLFFFKFKFIDLQVNIYL